MTMEPAQQQQQHFDDISLQSGVTGVDSGGTSTYSKQTGRKKKTAEEVSDRKKIKVLKQALKDERAQKGAVKEELDVVKERNKELVKEHEIMSNKYLALYDENDKLQELLNTMQYRIQSAEKDGSLQNDLAEISSKFDFLKKGLANGVEIHKAQREMQVQHETEL